MSAPTVDQIVALLNAGGQDATSKWLSSTTNSGGGWTGPAYTPQPTGAPGTNLGSLDAAQAYLAANGAGVGSAGGGMSPAVIASLFSGTGAASPYAPQAASPLVPGGLNVPYGSDYFAPGLDAYTRMEIARLQAEAQRAAQERQTGESGRQFDLRLGEDTRQFSSTFGEGQRQFDTNALMNAAQALASLYAQGPKSAAELAFANAGMGVPAIGGNAAAIAALIRSSTQGAGNPDATLDFGNGQGVSIPSTLGGRALAQLQADPNLAGVLASFAKAAGNPDILARSAAGAIPSGYAGSRYQNPVLSGLGI